MRKNACLYFAILLFAVLFIQGCSAASVPTPIIVTVRNSSFLVATQIVNETLEPPPITPTPPVSDPDGVFVTLSTAYQPPDPVQLSLGQKLYVVSPAGWGENGWNLTFDHSFFQLDSKNAPKGFSQGWWIWIPLKIGGSTIEIMEVPPPCFYSSNPCTLPQFGARLNVVVSK